LGSQEYLACECFVDDDTYRALGNTTEAFRKYHEQKMIFIGDSIKKQKT